MLSNLKSLYFQDCILPLKEISGTLGSIATIPEVAYRIEHSAGVEILTDVAERYIEHPKLVKTCIGTLVNLSMHDSILERMSNNLKFYEMLKAVLNTYCSSWFMMEYTLRLLVNSLKNKNCLFHMSESSFVYLIKVVFDVWKLEEEVLVYLVYALRQVASHSN